MLFPENIARNQMVVGGGKMRRISAARRRCSHNAGKYDRFVWSICSILACSSARHCHWIDRAGIRDRLFPGAGPAAKLSPSFSVPNSPRAGGGGRWALSPIWRCCKEDCKSTVSRHPGHYSGGSTEREPLFPDEGPPSDGKGNISATRQFQRP
jgi:hypothetical protein